MPKPLFESPSERVALVTGAASGIGAAAVRGLLDHGVGTVVATDRDETRLAEFVAGLEVPASRVLALAGDVADPGRWIEIESEIRRRCGRLDLALANAGITCSGSIVDFSIEEFRDVMAINVDGVFLTLKTALRLIAEGNRGGAIVAVSSVTGIKAQPHTAAYGASKAAVLQMAKVAAKEGAADKIRVNAILPGGVETPIWWGQPSFRDLVEKTGSEKGAFDTLAGMTTPTGRYSTPDEMAGQIIFLLSDIAANITGAALVADGGYAI